MNTFPGVGAVLFDWDGTLLNSCAADRRAYVKMFARMEIPWTLEEYDRHYSPVWYRIYAAAGIPRRRWKEADAIWRRLYARENPALLPGARAVLARLHGKYTLGLVSSGDRTRVMQQLRKHKLRRYFKVCICGSDTRFGKPHPAPLRLAMRQMGVSPAECLFVGDTAEDAEMARRAGVRSVGMLGPFPTHARLEAARPDAMIGAMRELPALLGI